MTHPMLTWFEAQLAEEEESAREGHIYSWHTRYRGNQPGSAMFGDCECDVPATVLALAAAHRSILFYHSGAHDCSGPDDNAMWILDGEICPTVRALVSAFAGREGYLEEWGPR